jgi:hypothetical protein
MEDHQQDWRRQTHQRMVRAIEFASQPNLVYGLSYFDFEREAVDCARELATEARTSGRLLADPKGQRYVA